MRFVVLFLALIAAAALVACGDDDASPTPTGGSPYASLVSGSPPGDKTSTPDQGSESPAATAPGETPTTPPVSAIGTPAAAPADQQAFSTSFAGQQVDQQECFYNPATAVVNCQGVLYAIDPPMTGQDISCTLWVVSGAPRAIACQAVEPAGTTYYEIEG